MNKRINLAAKITILKELTETHYKDLLNHMPDLFKDLVKIKDMRNRLSHLTLSVTLDSDERLKNKVVDFLEDNEIKTIPEGDIQTAINLAKYYVTSFSMMAFSNSSAS